MTEKDKEIQELRRKLEELSVSTALYDEEEIYPNCTVQVLRNSVTGEVSVGWWPNERM